MTLNVYYGDLDWTPNNHEQYAFGVLTMVIGMNTVTEKNLDEFYTRVSFYERLLGPVTEEPYTYDELKRWVGVVTNASPMTEAAFRKLHWENHKRDIYYSLKH